VSHGGARGQAAGGVDGEEAVKKVQQVVADDEGPLSARQPVRADKRRRYQVI